MSNSSTSWNRKCSASSAIALYLLSFGLYITCSLLQ
jgi:hypothetical protein